MFTTAKDTYSDWEKALIEIKVDKEDINEDLINYLAANDIEHKDLTDDAFNGYFKGDTEQEAGIEFAKEIAGLNQMQEYLETAIDWGKAWHNLKYNEHYLMAKGNRERVWLAFAKPL